MQRVMFVCLGNICRSPTAHGVFENMVQQAGLQTQVLIESSGTSAYHIGEPPDSRSITAASERGFQLSHIRAQQINSSDFELCDYLLAMDQQNLQLLKQLCPAEQQHKVRLFLDFGSLGRREVPDPYYGEGNGFALVLDLVEDAATGLLAEIRQQL